MKIEYERVVNHKQMLNFTYCEQSDFYFTQQPFNTFSSVAFFIIAYLLYQQLKPTDTKHKLLVALPVAIGIGSMLWHSTMQMWALATDVIPIFTFMMIFQYVFLSHVTDWNPRRKLYDVGGMLLAMAIFSLLWNDIFIQKSNAFIPVVLWLLYTARTAVAGRARLVRTLNMAAGVFAVSILMRIVDVPLCDLMPIGTHYLWHILSAVTLYMVMQTLRKDTHAEN